jgi:hypothetical protein
MSEETEINTELQPERGADQTAGNPHLLKHLEFLQTNISRMGAYSFVTRGWAITVAAAAVALVPGSTALRASLLALVPVLLFWGLDAYYLRQERLFRKLYDRVRSDPVRPPSEVDFSLDTRLVCGEVSGWVATCASKTILPFYGSLVVLIGLALALAIR